MDKFTYINVDDRKTIEIVLNRGFSEEDQERLMQLYQDFITKGVRDWDLNLKQLDMINSCMIGMLVSLNALIGSKNGKMRLILNRQSRVTDLLHLTKINKIIQFVIT